MFDDPKKQLDWMARELMSQEQPDEPARAGWAQTHEAEEDADLMQRVDALIGDEVLAPQSHAADFTRMIHTGEPMQKEKKTRAVKAVQAQTQKQPEPKKKGIKGLVFLAILETLGILAIIGWWIQWLT